MKNRSFRTSTPFKKISLIGFSTLFITLSSPAHADLVLTMGGDINFNKNRRNVDAAGVVLGNKPTNFTYFTKHLAPLLTGDLNFGNIETVVSSQNDLNDQDKKFAFKSHTNAVRNLLNIGMNLFNTANNHTYDYGQAGIERTFNEMNRLQSEYPEMVHNGINYRSDLLTPLEFEKNGIRIAFATASIGDPKFRATANKKGILFIRDDRDYFTLLDNFKKSTADFKILSIHMGTESQNNLDVGQKKRYEMALHRGGVNLIIGHHPHVIRATGHYSDSQAIFYSLGNYLMLGSADITRRSNINSDWGMFARLYLARNPDTQKVEISAYEVIPLTDTHAQVKTLPSFKAQERIKALNKLSRDQLQDKALTYKINPMTGSGYYCKETLHSFRAKLMCAVAMPLQE